MNIKLLSQAGAQALIQHPNQAKKIVYRLRQLIKFKYPYIKWGMLQKSIINNICLRENIEYYQIISAVRLDTSTRQKWQELLGKHCYLEFKEDSRILGGFIIKNNSRALDLSIRGRINKLQYALTSIKQ